MRSRFSIDFRFIQNSKNPTVGPNYSSHVSLVTTLPIKWTDKKANLTGCFRRDKAFDSKQVILTMSIL